MNYVMFVWLFVAVFLAGACLGVFFKTREFYKLLLQGVRPEEMKKDRAAFFVRLKVYTQDGAIILVEGISGETVSVSRDSSE